MIPVEQSSQKMKEIIGKSHTFHGLFDTQDIKTVDMYICSILILYVFTSIYLDTVYKHAVKKYIHFFTVSNTVMLFQSNYHKDFSHWPINHEKLVKP